MQNQINNILIVEDEEALLFGLKKLLAFPDVKIFTASSLDAAKDLLADNSFKAVITDLRLTGTNRMEGLDIIKISKEKQPDCKVIAMTAYAEERTKDGVEDLGVDYYLEKPVAPKVLKEILFSIGVRNDETFKAH